jgi:Tfp pilus assembly protein PilF
MFLETGQYPSAAIAATDLEKLNPDHLGGIEVRAVAFENLGVLDKSVDNYEDLYFKTGDFQSLYKVAFLQYQLKRYNESLTNIDVLLEKKEADELTAIFEAADNTEKEYPLKVALYNLKGMNAMGMNDKEAAKQYFQKALELAPDFQLALDNLASLNK